VESERRTLVARLATKRGSVALDEGTLVQMAERWAGEARATLQGSPEAARRGFEALLGGRRMEVHGDEARGFRVEGLFAPWMREAPRSRWTLRGASQVAGRRFVRVPTRLRGRRFLLAWAA
jgi:hypothetical protein